LFASTGFAGVCLRSGRSRLFDSKWLESCPQGYLEDPRQTFALEETGFNEAPKRFRRFYRRWRGAGDKLGPKEALMNGEV